LGLLEDFLGPVFTLPEPVDPEFSGTLSLVFDPDQPYTHKSRYFLAVRLTGSGDAGVLGNDSDNLFLPNAGDNTLEGGEGQDTVAWCADRSEFSISRDGEQVIVEGSSTGRDLLSGVEILHFMDGAVAVSDL
jgi:hypothetical protein